MFSISWAILGGWHQQQMSSKTYPVVFLLFKQFTGYYYNFCTSWLVYHFSVYHPVRILRPSIDLLHVIGVWLYAWLYCECWLYDSKMRKIGLLTFEFSTDYKTIDGKRTISGLKVFHIKSEGFILIIELEHYFGCG